MTHRIVRSVGGEPLHRLVHRSAPAVARRVVPKLIESVPFYALLPREELDGEITGIAEATVRLVAEVLRTGVQPLPRQLGRFGDSAARRAQEGVPLEMVLQAYHTGVGEVWHAFEPEVADRADVGLVLSMVLDCLSTLTGVIAAAYVAEREALAGSAQGERHRVVAALLGGESSEQLALGAGLRLAERYEVIAVAFGAEPPELGHPSSDSAIRTAITDRRRVRRVTAELARLTDGAALQLLDTSGGMILIPDDGSTDLLGLRAELATAAGTEVDFAAVAAIPEEVPAAARTAREVLRIVRLIGRAPGVHRLQDVLLQYQLSRPIEANHRLAALLDPLAEYPELVQTLRVHLGNELNRKRTASALHVHPNTVDYRLRRISILTDLDLALPSAQRLLAAALTAGTLLPATAARA
jgi:hypothetical protein